MRLMGVLTIATFSSFSSVSDRFLYQQELTPVGSKTRFLRQQRGPQPNIFQRNRVFCVSPNQVRLISDVNELRSQKSTHPHPLPGGDGGGGGLFLSRGLEQRSKNVSPRGGGVARPNYFDKTNPVRVLVTKPLQDPLQRILNES